MYICICLYRLTSKYLKLSLNHRNLSIIGDTWGGTLLVVDGDKSFTVQI